MGFFNFKNMANFETFNQVISQSINLQFLKRLLEQGTTLFQHYLVGILFISLTKSFHTPCVPSLRNSVQILNNPFQNYLSIAQFFYSGRPGIFCGGLAIGCIDDAVVVLEAPEVDEGAFAAATIPENPSPSPLWVCVIALAFSYCCSRSA